MRDPQTPPGPPPTRVLLSWSGGKDSAMALAALRARDDLEVVGLLTTLAGTDARVTHHGVREDLMVEQAAAVGLPLHPIHLPADRVGDQEYAALMERTMREHLARGIRAVAFGDLFLEDLRRYREHNLAKVGMSALFPLWGSDTDRLIRSFLAQGFHARLVCVCARRLGQQFAGRSLDLDLLRDLPPGVDPCGEHGEYHSFVTDGPGFARPVGVVPGEVVRRGEHWFADLLPHPASAPT